MGIESVEMNLRTVQHFEGYVQGRGYHYSQMAVDVIDIDKETWLLDYDRLLSGDKSLNFFERGNHIFHSGEYLLRVRTVWGFEGTEARFTLVAEANKDFRL